MKKMLLASLGLTLMLSATTGIAVAEETNPTANNQLIAVPTLTGNEQEPNGTFEQANPFFVGDSIIGTLGKEGVPGVWEAYDVFKFKAYESQKVHFTIQGDRYSDSWLQMTVYNSNHHKLSRSRDDQYFLDVEFEKGKEYYLVVEAPGLEPYTGRAFFYKVSTEPN
ncbi:hypothetical protein ACN92M_08320 [Paenibacillus polymyxa]|uniref:hypothetical protein n=1 Tax=Paenibacillus polymyxa TaxID=1406 RepID=UPI003B58F6B2